MDVTLRVTNKNLPPAVRHSYSRYSCKIRIVDVLQKISESIFKQAWPSALLIPVRSFRRDSKRINLLLHEHHENFQRAR